MVILTLSGQEFNCKAKNKSFKEKKELHQLSDILMTEDLTNYQDWTAAEIDLRQEELAKITLNIWKKIK